jgi:DNA-binding transcriptional LysR family regulator
MDRLRCMQIFVEVARDGSFSGAARRLGISKASVTKHVAWLEESLRAPLLSRTTKQVALTEAGRSALESAQQLLERYEQLEAEARDSMRQPKGLVRVGTPPSFGVHHLTPLVLGFTAQHPDIQVLLSLDDGSANLIAQGLDLSIRIAPGLGDSSYVAQPLTKAPQVLVAAPAYLEAKGTPRSPAELAGHSCLVHTLKSPTGIWRFTGPQGEVAVRVRGPLCSNFGEALQNAAVLGHGISMHPYYMVAEDLAAGRLRPVLAQYRPLELDIYAIFSSRQSLPVRVRRFVDYLKDWAKTPPPWAGGMLLAAPGAHPREKSPC